MHYSKRKDAEGRVAGARLMGFTCGLQDLETYLLSEKFHKDTTVQVGDVLLRIGEMRELADRLERDQLRMEAEKDSTF